MDEFGCRERERPWSSAVRAHCLEGRDCCWLWHSVCVAPQPVLTRALPQPVLIYLSDSTSAYFKAPRVGSRERAARSEATDDNFKLKEILD